MQHYRAEHFGVEYSQSTLTNNIMETLQEKSQGVKYDIFKDNCVIGTVILNFEEVVNGYLRGIIYFGAVDISMVGTTKQNREENGIVIDSVFVADGMQAPLRHSIIFLRSKECGLFYYSPTGDVYDIVRQPRCYKSAMDTKKEKEEDERSKEWQNIHKQEESKNESAKNPLRRDSQDRTPAA